jgi:SH3-like domain-containing protein
MGGRLRRAWLVCACLAAIVAPAAAQEPPSRPLPGVPVGTGLPIPRFAVLRSDEVNLRTGPGPRHPVEWVIRRRDLPVEITAEFDTWRRVRDIEGTEGWVHQSLLTGGRRRTVIVTGDVRPLRATPAATAAPVARAEAGVVARLLRCRAEWCEVDASGHRGWLLRTEMWGIYPTETVD